MLPEAAITVLNADGRGVSVVESGAVEIHVIVVEFNQSGALMQNHLECSALIGSTPDGLVVPLDRERAVAHSSGRFSVDRTAYARIQIVPECRNGRVAAQLRTRRKISVGEIVEFATERHIAVVADKQAGVVGAIKAEIKPDICQRGVIVADRNGTAGAGNA